MRSVSLSCGRSASQSVILVFLFTFLMVVTAYLRVPLFFTPVPLTLQTLVLYVSVIVLRRRAFFSQAGYLALGMAGVPVFANGGAGLFYLLGPTGGYLLGFLFAAAVLPYLYPVKKTLPALFFFFTLAACVVYVFGLAWLMFCYHLSFSAALLSGLYPFIPGAVVKILIACGIAFRYHRS